MKLRIRTDGYYPVRGQNVVVEDADTGRRLDGVTSVTWSVDGRSGYAVCNLTVRGVSIDVTHELSAADAAHLMLLGMEPDEV